MNHSSQWQTLESAADQFLKCRSIAVFGISRGNDDTAKIIYEKFRDEGYTVYGIHPTQEIVKGVRCYKNLASLPETVQGMVVVTKPSVTQPIMEQAIQQNVEWVWFHKSFGNSVDVESVSIARKNGIQVIDGGCPMMFLKPVDGAHKCFKVLLAWLGRIPKQIPVKSVDV